MSLPVLLRPGAEADIQAIHDDLEQSQAGLGARFVARVREVLERVESMPERYGWLKTTSSSHRTLMPRLLATRGTPGIGPEATERNHRTTASLSHPVAPRARA